MIGGFLIILGVLLWFLTGYALLGVVLIIIGVILLFAPGPWYGYNYYANRRRPPR